MTEEKINVPNFNVDETMDGLEELLEHQNVEDVLAAIRVHWKFITGVHLDCLKAQRTCIEILVSELSESRTTVQEQEAFLDTHPEIKLLTKLEKHYYGNS